MVSICGSIPSGIKSNYQRAVGARRAARTSHSEARASSNAPSIPARCGRRTGVVSEYCSPNDLRTPIHLIRSCAVPPRDSNYYDAARGSERKVGISSRNQALTRCAFRGTNRLLDLESDHWHMNSELSIRNWSQEVEGSPEALATNRHLLCMLRSFITCKQMSHAPLHGRRPH